MWKSIEIKNSGTHLLFKEANINDKTGKTNFEIIGNIYKNPKLLIEKQ